MIDNDNITGIGLGFLMTTDKKRGGVLKRCLKLDEIIAEQPLYSKECLKNVTG